MINERADEVFSILRLQGRRMRFRALGKDKADAAGELPLALAEAAPDEDSGRLTHHFLWRRPSAPMRSRAGCCA